MSLTPDDVQAFLRENPSFFDENPTLMAELELPNRHSGKALSLHERQIAVLRDKQRQLEIQIVEMSRAGALNQVTFDKMQAWHEAVLQEKSLENLPVSLTNALVTHFSVPIIHLCIWSPTVVELPGRFKPTASSAQIDAINLLEKPYCGGLPAFSLTGLLPQPDVQSLVIMPLRAATDAPCFGALILASSDLERYNEHLAQDFLRSLNASAAACLSRLIA
ncbi:MAG: DUF484 family protein [Burkholderiaceae bacterium]|jgi:uncharacterized protein YigA (DUF484 family)